LTGTPPEFVQWLDKGHGRAALFIDRHALQYACAYSTPFDPYEATRGRYLARLIDLAGQRDHFRAAAFQLVAEGPPGVHWDQWMSIANHWDDVELARALAGRIDAATDAPAPRIPNPKGSLRDASEAELRSLVTQEPDDSRAARIVLRMARQAPAARTLDFLIELAEADDDSTREQVRRAAVASLQQRRHPRIRQLAQRLWRQGRHADAGRLMVPWPDARDLVRLHQHARTLTDAQQLHQMELPMIDLLANHPRIRGAEPALRYLYEAGPCSTCRSTVVELLNRNGWLPEAWRWECRFDSNPETARQARRRRAAQSR
jgi:hypothetical protein